MRLSQKNKETYNYYLGMNDLNSIDSKTLDKGRQSAANLQESRHLVDQQRSSRLNIIILSNWRYSKLLLPCTLHNLSREHGRNSKCKDKGYHSSQTCKINKEKMKREANGERRL